MLIDSHCHLDRLDLTPYERSFERFVTATRAHGIRHMLCVSISLEAYRPMLELVENYTDISVSVGVHPNETECREPDADTLLTLAQHPKVVAIGETGLDYFRSEGDPAWQQERFRTHIRAALACGKPLIIHTREARQDTLRILREEGAEAVGGVLHCFTEDSETARAALDLNFYISFSGIITFRNAEQIREVARWVPSDRYLVETDSPYLAPLPHRGKPNYPYYVRQVAECLAQVRDVSPQQVAEETTSNYQRLFGGAGGVLL
ncbi:TatD family deoxyribonuclease [Candidatus Methylospira mobilis]|uniref:TatD family deoxyribonuclease n=1 Tax=Candidatus Methylospira mobilis TaxID=1808979 RepID=A0A5Q0BI92_9GAMM|nr:TatD family hydrolase [Candidatus Methylospira mobilis]QFY43605.1 TatD family deoxyribonuclease [Candidatus Methylospira mobilis]WNV04595.1 TatD family hydrolase [Candidatus Methylospira mobilis]